MRLIRARFLALGIAVALVLACAPSAWAAFAISGVTVTPSTTQAGAHPDLTISTAFSGTDPADTPRTFRLHLGPGILGNPLAAPTCPIATFETGVCPPDTVVGSSALSLVILATSGTATLPGVVYNLATDSPNQVAQLGITTFATNPAPPPALLPVSRLRSAVTISPVDLGLDSTAVDDLANATAATGPIRITNLSITLNGTAANGAYTSNPTACIPVAVTATATSYGGTTDTGSGGYTPTDCATEPFTASLSAALDTTATDRPAQVGVTISTPATDTPRRNADVLSSTVVLPQGMTINSALGVGLEACTDAQFAVADRLTAAACPAASRIGTVSLRSPLFAQTFEGPVYFATGTPPVANRLFVDVPVPGIHLKLVGRTLLDASTGRVTTVFAPLAQIPFLDFTLTFRGGPHSVLVTPQTCGTHTIGADLVPYARLTSPTPPDATPTTTFTTSFDGAGAACVSHFQPWMTAAVSNHRGGATTTFTLRFERLDRDARFDHVDFRLPPGLIGNLALAGLTRCSLADAAKAACAASSQIGHASVEVGVGSEPATLTGEMFLTARQQKGDAAGLSILVPAKLGPANLGDVIVGARLRLRSNGGLTVIGGTMPQIIGGVPLNVRSVALSFDRAGFMRNPTNCGSKRLTGVFDAVGGATAEAHARLGFTGCRRLPFHPRISATLGGPHQTGAGSHPPFATKITQRPGEAAIRHAYVTLPLALAANLPTIDAACDPAVFAADSAKCPRRSRIATAAARSPFVVGKLTGGAWLVKRPNGKLPRLVVQLRGPLAIDLEGFFKIGQGGRIATGFPVVPDVPITGFTLRFRAGPAGPLTAAESLCRKPLRLRAAFRGQNDEHLLVHPRITVHGCVQRRHR